MRCEARGRGDIDGEGDVNSTAMPMQRATTAVGQIGGETTRACGCTPRRPICVYNDELRGGNAENQETAKVEKVVLHRLGARQRRNMDEWLREGCRRRKKKVVRVKNVRALALVDLCTKQTERQTKCSGSLSRKQDK